jgi:hypothetical protein
MLESFESAETMTKRTWILVVCAVFAAMPLVWFSIDARAGEKLLKLTSGHTTLASTPQPTRR